MIRVLVAEDASGRALVALLGLEADIEVAVAVASGDQIVPAALEHRPDVALLDIGFLLKDKPAHELIGAVRAVARGAQVIDCRLAGPACQPEGDLGQARQPDQGREDGAAGSPR